jgi:hypothetical protein
MKKIETILRKCSILGDEFLLTTKTKRETNSLDGFFRNTKKSTKSISIF